MRITLIFIFACFGIVAFGSNAAAFKASQSVALNVDDMRYYACVINDEADQIPMSFAFQTPSAASNGTKFQIFDKGQKVFPEHRSEFDEFEINEVGREAWDFALTERSDVGEITRVIQITFRPYAKRRKEAEIIFRSASYGTEDVGLAMSGKCELSKGDLAFANVWGEYAK